VAGWLIDKGVDIEKVRHRLGHGDLTSDLLAELA
jgi:hypothetical protein